MWLLNQFTLLALKSPFCIEYLWLKLVVTYKMYNIKNKKAFLNANDATYIVTIYVYIYIF